jgi:hypothetical protein
MADRLSWLALVAALTFSASVVVLGAGGKAAEPEPDAGTHALSDRSL